MKAILALGAAMVLFGAGCLTTKRQTVEQSPAICDSWGRMSEWEPAPGARGEAGLRHVN